MKLVRYGVAGHERPGVLIGEDIFDASILAADYDETFFANEGLERLKKAADEGLLKKVGADIRLGPPIARPSKLICVGLNYRDHAAETNAKIPAEPILFFKSTTAIVGPNDDLILPMDSVKTDWEVELAVVIGRQASYVKQSEAEEYIAGSCCTMITVNGNFSWNVVDSGLREKAATPLRHWAHSWRPEMKYPTLTICVFGLR